jgi:K+-transporting ATPase ATPase C chain
MTIITGLIYTFFITAISSLLFNYKSGGSIVYNNRKAVGSELLGQQFISAEYFQSRPSAVSCNPMPSAGTNLSASSSKLLAEYKNRKEIFIKANGLNNNAYIPSDALFASASGVDPHSSPETVMLQINRISEARKFSRNKKEKLLNLVASMTEKPQLGFLGRPKINIFLLNLELDKLSKDGNE